jgi:hypothetical protein
VAGPVETVPPVRRSGAGERVGRRFDAELARGEHQSRLGSDDD